MVNGTDTLHLERICFSLSDKLEDFKRMWQTNYFFLETGCRTNLSSTGWDREGAKYLITLFYLIHLVIFAFFTFFPIYCFSFSYLLLVHLCYLCYKTTKYCIN